MQSLFVIDQVEILIFCRWASDVVQNYADAFQDVWFNDESQFIPELRRRSVDMNNVYVMQDGMHTENIVLGA